MKEVFQEIFQEYLRESMHNISNNRHGRFIRNKVPKEIRASLNISEKKFKIAASPGQGYWAAVPWIGVFDKEITKTAKKGYYITYLFRADMSGVYLSLNQGWEFIKSTYGIKKGQVIIRRFTNAWQKNLTANTRDFSFDPIDLRATRKHSSLPKGYELGHICGKYYDAKALPDEQVLINDLKNMLAVYRELKVKMRNNSVEKTNEYILADEFVEICDTYDNNDDDMNRLLIDPGKMTLDLQNRPSKVRKYKPSDGRGHKTNHVKKQINDMRIGLLGEKIVVEYEKKSLLNEGRADLAEEIEHISEEKGDGTGYDILSFDRNGNIKYIEVKTTVSGVDTPFHITDSELNFSAQNSGNYALYRLYDLNIKKSSASFYILNGDISRIVRFKATQY